MNLTKIAISSILISTLISSTSTMSQTNTPEEATTDKPNIPGVVPSDIDSATPGLMPINPLKDVPEDVMAILDTLSDTKRDFVLSGKAGTVIGKDVLFKLLTSDSKNDPEQYIDTVMSIYERIPFNEATNKGAIELDQSSPEFNSWRLKRPQSLNPDREPGPIKLSRYLSGRGMGIPTFASAPVALTPEDLIAGEVDVAIMGAPLDMGSGWRDAIHGPRAMRMLRRGTSGTDVSTMVNPGSVLNIVDYGNAAIDQLSTERSIEEVRSMVREIAETGAVPIIIGGDHSLEYPNVAGIADVYGKGKVAVVHFDAHLDTGRGRVHLLSHGQPIYRLMKEAHVRPEDFIQVGLRAHYSKSYYEWEKEIGMKYHTMAEVERRGWDDVMDRVIKEATEHTDYLYVSFDVDVLDPAFQPGTGTPVSGGLTMREAIPIVRRLCAETKLVGFDIVELAPALDASYVGALNANSLMFACMTGIAMHKKGITEKAFISELSSEHGQDNYYGEKK
ncbi:agmatinase family protein [Paraglaciecola sp. 2405UD69-4]|uniref:agmatinase family protein n=1 Tax=Paraglaciecola sp. 2405UD69-4 TaxID=3391836 RepID=UPI0039C9414C